MPIVATVTRASASRFFSQQPGLSVDSSGGNQYTLRKADGDSLGTYRSVSEAQNIFRRFHGVSRILRWEQRNLPGDIEQHVCIGLPLDPSEIWVLQPGSAQVPNSQPILTSLILWAEPSVAPGSVLLSNVTTGAIRRIGDISGSGNILLGSNDPVQVAADADFNGRTSVDLDRTLPQGFTVPNLASLAPPYSIVMVANNLLPTANGNLLDVDPGGATPLQLQEGGGARWQLDVGGTVRTSDVAGSASPAILTVKVSATETIFRVNGVQVGSAIASVPSAGVLEIGGISTSGWTGRFSFLSVANIADPDNTRILQTERYARERYQ